MSDIIDTSAEYAENDAMPRKIDVHTDGDVPSGTEDLPEAVTRKPVKQKSPAEWAYERLALYIQNFEQQLDSNHEVAMGFAGSDAGVLRIEGLGFFDPDIITFYGSDMDGAKTQLIQHVTQLSVILRAMPKLPDHEEPRRIGFQLTTGIDEA
ncbi:DUF6173 family protein [Pseudoprimorskyibacter insulae]|uniref:Uncharacterized protein n=1 Tax=Pseudoprimorskyibacter insulae TaxID=1695997 RepID=A0A2R8ANJ8_9RHOB|nr:DUF6173 family protein [Pseudoprimorskyibacter insulae]SPF77570.1 hypothetical protein PRI8871_00153 [Pseudoprimorskyibacter insulae]